MQKKRRIFNNRPICFCALALGAGVLVGEAMSALNPLFRLIPLTIFLIVAIIFCINLKTRKFAYLVIALAVGFIGISASNDIYNSHSIDKTNGTFQATVISEIVVEDGKTAFYVGDLIVNGKKLDGKGFISVPYELTPNYGAGDMISIKGTILFNEHKPFDTFYASKVTKKEYYFIFGNNVKKLADGELKFPLNLQMRLKRLIFENTNYDTASICQALLLGDKFGISDNLYNMIKSSGVAHLLAVSGLHISALSGALYFLLKKLKVHPKIRFAIVGIITFLYVMLCSFSPSALRAFIMVMVFSASDVFGKKHDNLSALGLSCVLLIFFRPTSVLDIGFLLSVFAVLGIILFGKPIANFGLRAAGGAKDKFSHCFAKLLKRDAVALAAHGNTAIAVNDELSYAGGAFITTYEITTTANNQQNGSLAHANDGNAKSLDSGNPKGKSRGRIKRKHKHHPSLWLMNSVSLSLSTNVMTYPLVTLFFGVFPTLFIISNLIILPYMMFIYLFLLVIGVFALITGFGSLFGIMDYLLMPFKALVLTFWSTPLSTVDVSIGIVGVVCFMLCFILMSRYVFLTKRQRVIFILSICAISIVIATII